MVPSLYQLCCAVYGPEGSIVPERQEYRGSLMRDMRSPSLTGLVLERRESAPEVEYLSRPPRYNPFQWRVVYMPPVSEQRWRLVVVINGRPSGTRRVDPWTKGVIMAGHEVVEQLRDEFGRVTDPGKECEEVWRNQADLALRRLGGMASLQTSWAQTPQTVRERTRRLQRMREQERLEDERLERRGAGR